MYKKKNKDQSRVIQNKIKVDYLNSMDLFMLILFKVWVLEHCAAKDFNINFSFGYFQPKTSYRESRESWPMELVKFKVG